MLAWTAARVLCCTLAIAFLRGQCTNAHPLADSTLPLSEVIWRPEADGIFVGSPSIVALSNGSLVASHDDFGPYAVSCSEAVCRPRNACRRSKMASLATRTAPQASRPDPLPRLPRAGYQQPGRRHVSTYAQRL